MNLAEKPVDQVGHKQKAKSNKENQNSNYRSERVQNESHQSYDADFLNESSILKRKQNLKSIDLDTLYLI